MKIGFTTSVPVEVLFAAGVTPVDLNNVFVNDQEAGLLIEMAERAGYPRNVCAWIKGIYGVVFRDPEIRTVIAVTQGDCSNTYALMETLKFEGITVIPFGYPYDRDRRTLELQIERLMAYFNIDWPAVKRAKAEIDAVREKVSEIDRLTYVANKVTGGENHYYQVSCSDFEGDFATYGDSVQAFLQEAKQRSPIVAGIRLGYIGVPPIFSDLYAYIEECGAQVVYNETQRQFAMPYKTADLIEQYLLYTYPYGILYRIEDIKKEIERRDVVGVIHYVQSFCFRQIEDLIVRRVLGVPVLTIEGDRPGVLDARTRIRFDAFLEMLA